MLELFKTKKEYDEFTFTVKTGYSYNIFAPVYNYAGFNNKLPMPILCEHGWYASDYPIPSDLNQNPKFVLVFNKRRKEVWDTKSNIPSAIFGAPFVRYRHLAKISQNEDAKGTIAFPAHSDFLASIEFEFDWLDYCNTLKAIPDEFHPIDICMHPNDIAKGYGKICEKEGFKVLCASTYNKNQEFMQNFYEILSQYKFATSNEISSSAMYAIELGLPFFLQGRYPTYNFIEDGLDCAKGSYSENPLAEYKVAEKFIPHEPCKEISRELKEYVDSEMGVYDCISPNELYNIILQYYDRSYPFLKLIFRPFEVVYKLFARPYRKWREKRMFKENLIQEQE